MDASLIFPQGVLSAITLIGSVVSVGGSKSCAGCEAGFPLCLVDVTTLSGMRSAPQMLKQKP